MNGPRRAQRCAQFASLALASACGTDGAQDAPSAGGAARSRQEPEDAAGDPGPGLFVERTAGCGVDFVHRCGAAGRKLLVEINAGGASLLDYDGDGDLDLFFPQGAPLPGCDPAGGDWRDRLYRNDGGWRFTDVTDALHASDDAFTYAAACPDVDGDGDPDLYLLNTGRNRWLRNEVREGRGFVDATGELGADAPEWSTAAAFVDFDRDGDLDLYVVNYIELALDHPGCGDLSKGEAWRSYCHPDEFAPAPDRLYRNDGGRFVDASEALGAAGRGGAGLCAVPCDFDGDGDVDLFVANDSNPNFLWRNDGGLRFTEVAAEAWVAVDGSGISTAAMGSDFGDVDGDGDFDLVVANLAMELNNLYRNDGAGRFDDRSLASGFGAPALLYVGFGCELFDADLDGDQDALVVNGHVIDNVELYEPAQTFRQPALLMRNDGRGRFARAPAAEAGAWFGERRVARGLALGDLDGDGDPDAVVGHWNGAPSLLENRAIAPGRPAPRWIALHLKGAGAATQALGAQVVVSAGGRRFVEEVRGTSGYLAWHDLRLTFGLGGADAADAVDVRWPDGSTSRHGPLAAGRLHEIAQPVR